MQSAKLPHFRRKILGFSGVINSCVRYVLPATGLFLALLLPLLAQRSPLPLGPSNSVTPPQPIPADPLGRSTPRGTITELVRAFNHEDFVSAARYMQLNVKQRSSSADLGKDLKELMDRYFRQPLTLISDSPTGAHDDGLPLDREKIGPLDTPNGPTDIILVRVDDAQAGPIWLISSESLAKIPALHDTMAKSWVERVMPEALLRHHVFGISDAQWLLLFASIALPALVFWLLIQVAVTLSRRSVARLRQFWHEPTRWPLITVLTLVVHLVVVRSLDLSLRFRINYMRCGVVLLVIGLCWLIQRISARFFERARGVMRRKRQSDTESLMLLGQRVFNVVLVLAVIFLILTAAGIDTRTALTGLGIGGVALAFGAQKTVENLLGGISLLTDKALAVGDFCCISSRLGTIEDITLRSIRLRTLEQTLLSIPAGMLSQENVENFSTRKKILAQGTLPLRYGTSAEQIRTVLDGIRRIVTETPQIETATSRVRLINFGARAIELEFFVYIITDDILKFFAEREQFLLKIADIVEASGSAFAMPTPFVYLDSMLDQNGNAPLSSAKSEIPAA